MNGNGLYFTLMYVFYKLDFNNSILGISELRFINLAYQLQMTYRDNAYHN
jgi:hypothetical protein